MRHLFASSFLLAAHLSGGAFAQEISLRLPVACEIGKSCFIQHYVDRDPTPAAQDFQCGSLTYEGHDGTDIRLPTMAAQKAGVEVVAAADGKVLRVRDGVADVSVSAAASDRASVDNRECGNGLVVDHGQGWETQYCHMAKGSLSARPGDDVKAGDALGRVGLSGMTEFPHLHFTLRKDGKVVDPFAFGAEANSCGGGRSLWDAKTASTLSYRAGDVLNKGFADGPITMAAVESGEIEQFARRRRSESQAR
jgi:murein DD-endopeptidase MepM/ murein hydrolase activator NlpD